MNLCNRPVYQKGAKHKSRGKSRLPTREERQRWGKMAALGCIVAECNCSGRITIHHCGTGGGGRKDHGKVIPLCEFHHQGAEGIDGKRMSKREWQEKYGTEADLMAEVERLLDYARVLQ